MDLEERPMTLSRSALPPLIALLMGVMLIVFAPAGYAQNAESQPGVITKERTALYLKGVHTPLKELEADLNHLALASEICRAEHSAKPCGLPEKALASDKLEERYSYYVKGPVEIHFGGHQVRVEKRNWQRPRTPDSK